MNANELRQSISTAYAKALAAAGAGGGCCGGSACCGPDKGSRDLADMAGYGQERREHAAAAATSFGCGNPLAFSGVQAGQTVLDLGSGAGFDLLLASDKVGPQGLVIGVDMTEAMLAAARENIRQAGRTNIEVRKGIIEALPVADASVDWVISNCVINLSPDKPAVFAEIARVLKPGGRISISDIVARDLPAWIRESLEGHVACVAGAISETHYLEGLRQAGIGDAAVTERLVYSASQLQAIFGDTLNALPRPQDHGDVFAALEGKIWSAKFVGGKPA
jgi:SAM-dependent methyltransferase